MRDRERWIEEKRQEIMGLRDAALYDGHDVGRLLHTVVFAAQIRPLLFSV